MFASRILALMAAGAAIIPAAVSAAPADDDNRIVQHSSVQTNDLDLASDAGKRALKMRIARAASHVCEGGEDAGTNAVREARCRQAALTDARAQMDAILTRSTPHFAAAQPAPAPTNTASGS